MTFEQIYEPQMKETVVRKILEALPDWFAMEEGREQYIKESAEQICIGAVEDTEYIGFLCLKETGKDTLELAVMGVLKEYHRQGIGREMFMMALYNMDGNPITYGTNNYTDVEAGRWSEAAIVWGNAKGLIAGFPDGSFRPTEPVTREQVATIMKKYATYQSKYTADRRQLSSFNDYAIVADWSYESISWAVAKGIIKGDSSNNILPQKSATRAEVAAMFMNYKNAY